MACWLSGSMHSACSAEHVQTTTGCGLSAWGRCRHCLFCAHECLKWLGRLVMVMCAMNKGLITLKAWPVSCTTTLHPALPCRYGDWWAGWSG